MAMPLSPILVFMPPPPFENVVVVLFKNGLFLV